MSFDFPSRPVREPSAPAGEPQREAESATGEGFLSRTPEELRHLGRFNRFADRLRFAPWPASGGAAGRQLDQVVVLEGAEVVVSGEQQGGAPILKGRARRDGFPIVRRQAQGLEVPGHQGGQGSGIACRSDRLGQRV